MNQGLAAVQLGSHDGFWYEQPDFWSKYLRRPADLKEICFAQFARMYKGGMKKELEDEEEEMQKEVFQGFKQEEDTDSWFIAKK